MGDDEQMTFGYLSETAHIHDYLVTLNNVGFYTFSSQPWSTPETHRGVAPHQLEYVSGMIDPQVLKMVRLYLCKHHPNILVSTPHKPVVIPVSRAADGSAWCNSWGGRMARPLYEARLGADQIDSLDCVEFVHCNWNRHDDYLFKVLTHCLSDHSSMH